MTWIPDWENMQRKEFAIHYYDEMYGEEVEEMAELSIEVDDTYRLLEQPLLYDYLKWGDLIRATRIDDSNLRLVKILEHAQHTEGSYVMGGDLGSLGKARFLQKIMDDGGYCEQLMGGYLTIFYPPGKQQGDYW
jgi:hypothetical protein